MRALNILWRLIVIVCCALIVSLTLMLWDATGRAGYTRFHDPERAQREAEARSESLEDLFADTGIETLPAMENRTRLGLAPSGFDAHLASVITIAGPAMVIGLGAGASLVLLLMRRAKADDKP